jgi:hypothetical protein
LENKGIERWYPYMGKGGRERGNLFFEVFAYGQVGDWGREKGDDWFVVISYNERGERREKRIKRDKKR